MALKKKEDPKEELLGIEKLTIADFKPNTAVLFININGNLYAQGIDALNVKSDTQLYNSLIRVGNLVATGQRTLYYSEANRKGLMQEFMDNIKPKEDRDNGL